MELDNSSACSIVLLSSLKLEQGHGVVSQGEVLEFAVCGQCSRNHTFRAVLE